MTREEFIGIAADADMRHAGLKPEHEDLGIGGDPITAGMIRAETVERVTAVLSRVGAWELYRAAGSVVWLGNNLHNIKAAPDQFRGFYEAALKDAEDARAIAEKRS